MKVIDLLNKIANGEEIDFLFKIGLWEYSPEDEDIEYELLNRLSDDDFKLNDEIEIIEEKKIPEKLKLYAPYSECDDTRLEDMEDKINEIIDYLEENK